MPPSHLSLEIIGDPVLAAVAVDILDLEHRVGIRRAFEVLAGLHRVVDLGLDIVRSFRGMSESDKTADHEERDKCIDAGRCRVTPGQDMARRARRTRLTLDRVGGHAKGVVVATRRSGNRLVGGAPGFGLTLTAVRLRVGLARPAPRMTLRRCVGPSLIEACMARPSMVVPNTDFQK